jgi:hypothetical protein
VDDVPKLVEAQPALLLQANVQLDGEVLRLSLRSKQQFVARPRFGLPLTIGLHSIPA